MAKPVELNENWLVRITEAVEGLKYGTVQIVVHDGRIVQIERTERFRYEGSVEGKQPARKAE
ncbi:YezD family protein [Cohnella faecalis]|uniref:DUF2292 domain-containing protein n=1 Tax=Cohnella faecalis TaxID=2315694 RepID=A0A398CPW9_9BACL|nr:YezD family protein [Cohnella faecalis]RIE02788.1 DUF2292 domain-containing protein [Cohnella faecalis]